MNLEKTIDALNISKDSETIINFLDIKILNSLKERLTQLFNNFFSNIQDFNNIKILQKNDIEILNLKKTFKFSFESKNDISLVASKVEQKESKLLVEQNISDKKGFEHIKKFSKTLDGKHVVDSRGGEKTDNFEIMNQSLKCSKEQMEDTLDFILKLTRHNFFSKNLFKNRNEKIEKKVLSEINPNKSFLDSIKLNLKLFNEAFSKALNHIELFQTRLIEQPPFGIVAFYVKDQEKKNFIKRSRKKRFLKKQRKHKKKVFE